MPFAMNLEDEECSKCGKEELVYWTKDETESMIEVYMKCEQCEYDYPKEFINKSSDTSDKAILETLKEKL